MKQILQHLASGDTVLEEVPAPQVRRGHVLVRTRCSLVSAGTERMLVEFGRANLLEKARQQPDKVRMVLDKVRTDGLFATLAAVRSKLDQPLALGYCSVGEVIEVGAAVTDLAVGDRVACNGRHAEINCVPRNLCAKVPTGIADEQAAFTVLGAIALQGMRLAQPTLGEAVVVIGLGLVGLLTVQLLRAQGCRVFGLDTNGERVDLARTFGAEGTRVAADVDPIAAAHRFARGRGVDAVIIAASTDSDEPVRQAAAMCRKRGRIVLVGTAGLSLSRADFYEKELSFQVSCSYGPGRYDPAYEEGGADYPLGFVRWTEQRNFEAVLDMMAERRIDCAALISHRFAIDDARRAYDVLTREAALGILLDYPGTAENGPAERTIHLAQRAEASRTSAAPRVAFIGSGAYASRALLPAFSAAGAELHAVVSRGGVSAVHNARKYGADAASTDVAAVIADAAVDAIVIATRHDSHADLVCAALAAGKHVFCEKPLAMNREELARIETQHARPLHGAQRILQVGFNRRFAPFVQRVQRLLRGMDAPRTLVMTVNAGEIPGEHWTQGAEGGGRVIGEVCHFVDLLRHLAGASIERVSVTGMGGGNDATRADTLTCTLAFANGSFGSINYFANGHRTFPKERLEVFCAGRILQLDNFRRLRAWGWTGAGRRSLTQDKGNRACVAAFVDAMRSGTPAPIPFEELVEVTRTTFDIVEALHR